MKNFATKLKKIIENHKEDVNSVILSKLVVDGPIKFSSDGNFILDHFVGGDKIDTLYLAKDSEGHNVVLYDGTNHDRNAVAFPIKNRSLEWNLKLMELLSTYFSNPTLND